MLARALLVALASYELVCFSDNIQMLEHRPLRFADVTWPMIWQMFTLKSDGQENIWYEGRYGDVWVKLPMAEWFPAAWESGYRWERAASTRQRVGPYLEAACARSDADEVRAVRRVWKRRLGTAAQFARDANTTYKGARRCR